MSFGFSVGDVITGANLAYQLLRALSDSQGSSKEYQEVIQELGCVQQTFLHVEQMRSCNLFSKATLNAISYIINSSVDVIARFLERTEKYRQSLSNNGGKSLYMDSWRKVGWSLFKKEELNALRDTLQTRLTAISILVNTASHQNQYILPNEIAKFHTSSFEHRPRQQQASDSWSTSTLAAETASREMKGGKEQMKSGNTNQTHERQEEYLSKDSDPDDEQNDDISMDSVDDEENTRQQAPTTPNTQDGPNVEEDEEKKKKKQSILFKDAVGRKFKFPFHLCSTWQGIEELIRQAFLHVEIIGPHVVEGHYDLVGPDGTIILPQIWESVIEPDWTVTMHMWPLPEMKKASKPSTPESTTQEPSQNRDDVHPKQSIISKFAKLGRRIRDDAGKPQRLD